MKKIFYTILAIVLFNSCIEEYEVFYPYKNTTISYLKQLQNEGEKAVIAKNKSFKQVFEKGLIVELAENSFADSYDTINFSLKQVNTIGKLIANRISMEDVNKNLINNTNIIEFSFSDINGNHISLKTGNFIKFKIPYNNLKVPNIFRLTSKGWIISTYENDKLIKSTWEVTGSEDPIIQKGYILSTDKQGIFCIGQTISENLIIDRIRISLPDGFNVDNSIVQMSLPELNTNVELYWDGESKTFELPHKLQVPETEVNMTVISENSNMQAFFGMKYATLKNGDLIEVDVSKKRIEEIKSILDNL